MLCMSAMAAVSAVSFAQTDVTSKLLNPDMERGLLGWEVYFDGSDIWKKTVKNQSRREDIASTRRATTRVQVTMAK